MVSQQRDPERTRAELLAVATEVFAEDGFSGARVDVIAERTRTTKRMIYYYFGSKEQLYLAVLEDAYRGIREAESVIDVSHSDPVAAMRQLAELTFDHHVTHDGFIRLVAIENIHRGEFIRRIDALRALSQPARSRIEEILRRGRDRGVFRDDVDALDVHLLISAYCVFQVANKYTFGYLFDVDLDAPDRRSRLRAMIGDVVVAWLQTR
ncbi:MAG: TetR/AcrR family transcriptional regulator [Microbacterium sp.]